MRGYFGIGVYHCKNSHNIGMLWRSANQLGAAFIFVIGKRYRRQASDTMKTYRHVPLFQFEDWDIFTKSKIYSCPIICIEMGGRPIKNFVHPESCVYLLGAEDGGIPKDILKGKQVIELPAVRKPSFNVAISGSIIMFDRLNKLSPPVNKVKLT